MTTIKKSQNGEKLKPVISGPYSVKKYLKTKNPKSNFNIKGEKTNLEIDTTGYSAGKKTFRGLETSTKPGKSRPVGIKANRDAITDAINKGTNKAKMKAGGMIKRADGSMSRRGLWDNLRSKAAQNKKTGAKPKAPSKAMLTQEKKIKAKGK